jgi:capsular polysaccharide biosynthesis protein
LQEQVCIQEDEIDLRELFKTLVKNKKFIIIFTTITTLLALVYVMVKTPIYEAKALIEIGSYQLINDNDNEDEFKSYHKVNIEKTALLLKKLNTLYIFQNDKNKVSKISAITIPKRSDSFIEVRSLAINNDLAKKEIEKLVLYIQSKHKKILDNVKNRTKLEVENIDNEIKNIKNNKIRLLLEKIDIAKISLLDYKQMLKNIDENIKKIQNIDPSLTALELMKKSDLTSMILKLNMQIIDMKKEKNYLETTVVNSLFEKKEMIEYRVLPQNHKNTQIVGKIITNDHPVKPKKLLIIIVAFITGLILSIFLVFIIEFFRDEDKHK